MSLKRLGYSARPRGAYAKMSKDAQTCASAETKCWQPTLEFATFNSYQVDHNDAEDALARQLSGSK